ncbi:MAG TPA: nicotinate-nucleotide adenylyltransferase [Nitrosospira sp.]|nr:nicotinate-nucleotide adenylyltransferase [Nitrosospira sp.]
MHNSGCPLIGIFGGTFDPIHYGHLRAAEEIGEIADLPEIRFIPAGMPRLRGSPVASLRHRVTMVHLAIRNNPRFTLDEREVQREGISRTVESLREMKQELKAVGLCFITGADAFGKLAEWHSWRELFQLCHFIVAARPGRASRMDCDELPGELKEECAGRWVGSADSLRQTPSGLIFVAPTTLLDISATSIRSRVAAGKSLRYLIPDPVLNYIAANRLYSDEL